MSMYYTFLYTQISEDINEMKYKLKNCYNSIVNEENQGEESPETFRTRTKKRTKLPKKK